MAQEDRVADDVKIKLTYRGYDLERVGRGRWTVSLREKPVGTFATEEAAMAYVDAEKRRKA